MREPNYCTAYTASMRCRRTARSCPHATPHAAACNAACNAACCVVTHLVDEAHVALVVDGVLHRPDLHVHARHLPVLVRQQAAVRGGDAGGGGGRGRSGFGFRPNCAVLPSEAGGCGAGPAAPRCRVLTPPIPTPASPKTRRLPLPRPTQRTVLRSGQALEHLLGLCLRDAAVLHQVLRERKAVDPGHRRRNARRAAPRGAWLCVVFISTPTPTTAPFGRH